MGEMERACRILVCKRERKRPLEVTYRWVDNIKMDLIEVEYEDVDCIYLA
jgi:hypothetical protein